MSKNNGFWLYTELSPSEYVANGIPKIGDPVKLDYDTRFQPWVGTVTPVGSSVETAKKGYEAKEFGASFIFSGNF